MENQKIEKKIFFEYDRFPLFGKFFKFLFPHLRNHLLSKKRRPLMIICETVNICNNDCIICAHQKMTRKKEIMPLSVFHKILRDYSDIGGGKLSLTPMVGDIFLDKLIIDRLKMISYYPKITGLSVTTNAIAADKFSDPELFYICNRFERIQISIYGLDAKEYEIMTRRNHYSHMLKNVKKIVDILENKNKIFFGFRFLKVHTIDEIKLWIRDKFGADIPFGYTNVYSNWGNSMDTNIKLPFSGEWLPTPDNKESCLVPLFALQIFSNGNVSFCPCPDYNNITELHLGSVTQDHLINIYNSEKCHNLLNPAKTLPNFCRHCSFFRPLSDLPQYEDAIDNPILFVGG